MSDTRLSIRQVDSAVEVALHVQPRARRDEIVGLFNGALKLKLCAPPVNDAANRAVIDFFASLLNLPKSRLQIISGMKSRSKVLRIESITAVELRRRLQDLDVKLFLRQP
ncbi:MAG TPA: DUF167 domain-containing protein [Acidobacteriota bacterium]|nr:DUF167 domain-containing protein [Acidobacteriota bacterium]